MAEERERERMARVDGLPKCLPIDSLCEKVDVHSKQSLGQGDRGRELESVREVIEIEHGKKGSA